MRVGAVADNPRMVGSPFFAAAEYVFHPAGPVTNKNARTDPLTGVQHFRKGSNDRAGLPKRQADRNRFSEVNFNVTKSSTSIILPA